MRYSCNCVVFLVDEEQTSVCGENVHLRIIIGRMLSEQHESGSNVSQLGHFARGHRRLHVGTGDLRARGARVLWRRCLQQRRHVRHRPIRRRRLLRFATEDGDERASVLTGHDAVEDEVHAAVHDRQHFHQFTCTL